MNVDALSLLVIILAILPGLLGYWTYGGFFGSNWRESLFEKTLKVILISVLGLVLYVIFNPLVDLPPPLHVLPSTYDLNEFSQQTLHPIALAYLGHVIASEIVVIFAVFVIRGLQRWLPTSLLPGAWDEFARNLIDGHWVVVSLTSGEAYAGIVYYADISVRQQERDLIILEPAVYEKGSRNYKATPYQHLFLPSTLISSVATISDGEDKRITTVNSMVFSKGKRHGRKPRKKSPAKYTTTR
jgi:hypothetical protein